MPDLYINKGSGALVANGSTPEIVINALQQVNSDDLPQIGRQFLSSAYLMLNQDANSFTVWEASSQDDVDLVAVDEANRQVDQFCDAARKNATSPIHSAEPSASDSSQGNGISAGAIAGIAVGCVVGVSIIAGGAFFWMKRKNKDQDEPRSDESYVHQSSGGTYTTVPPSDLGLKPPFHYELPASNRTTASSGLAELP